MAKNTETVAFWDVQLCLQFGVTNNISEEAAACIVRVS